MGGGHEDTGQVVRLNKPGKEEKRLLYACVFEPHSCDQNYKINVLFCCFLLCVCVCVCVCWGSYVCVLGEL